eukprot:TRINITY_DN2066_c0_g1_i8.p4 TRINITY_DN2066_c0_g1~~TRINITY_DN2066_c0_g1_i8.p4  ORF type:complete len:158 (+),score=56.13 TRINITY_DN2066_c0_g1_i8:574-1047(+)
MRAGRVVFAVQCKHWAEDVAKDGLHSLAYFRYGRHCFEADQVYAGKYKGKGDNKTGKTKGAAKRLANSFRAKFCNMVEQNKDSDTRVVFVLATVNDITQARVKASVFKKVNLPDNAKYKSTALLEDEGLMDLQHMCGWCPTVGYGALLAEKLREFPL